MNLMQKSISTRFVLDYCIFVLLIGMMIIIGIQQLEIEKINVKNAGFVDELSNTPTSLHGQIAQQSEEIKILKGRLIDHQNYTIFVGDSLTAYGNWAERFPESLLSNDGISGDTTGGVLNRINNIDPEKPDRIFIMVGINDLIRGYNSSAIIANYTTILGSINNNSPSTKIYILSVLPVNYGAYNKTDPTMRKVDNNQITDLNNNLSQISKNYDDSEFINLYPYFIDSQGDLQANLTIDGIHLSPQGYEIWANLIKNYMMN